MKVSLKIINQFTNVDLSTAKLVDMIGSQLGSVESLTDLGAQYKGIIVAKTVDCNPHPNADKLSVCFLDDGGVTKDVHRDNRGLVRVVCGASNVGRDQLVAWVTPGTKLPGAKNDETIDAREIRGVVSDGMIASAKELGIGDEHDGILIIDEQVRVGRPFSELYDLDDTIIELENKMFTHRPDCFGQLGVAREIAGIAHKKFSSPAWYLNAPAATKPVSDLPLVINNLLPDLVPRFMAQVVRGVKVAPSSTLLQSYLSRLGVKPINNVVDQTNYLMLLTAQPLHAYDYDKLKSLDGDSSKATIVIRHPKPDETFKLLNGKTITPNKDAVLIASAKRAIGIGGVMGGADTEVDNSTTNIIIECATFDMYSTRRTAMHEGLFTEAVTRFNKGQSPLQNDRVLAKTCSEITNVAGGDALSSYDNKSKLSTLSKIKVKPKFISSRLGIDFTAPAATKLLSNVEFSTSSSNDEFEITPPFWRTDVEIAEDVVEEVGRLYGYSRLPLKLPLRPISAVVKDPMTSLKSRIRLLLVGAGANEVLTYSFVHGKLLDDALQDKKLAFQLSNAISPDVQYYRLSLTPSLLDKIHPNIKMGFNEFAIFEMNKVHIKGVNDPKDKSLPAEQYRLSIVCVADDKAAKANYSGAPYYQALLYVDYLLSSLGVSYKLIPSTKQPANLADQQASKPFEPVRSALVTVNDEVAGIVGEPLSSVKRALKLSNFISMAELDIERILANYSQASSYQALSRYPRVEQDICLKVSNDVNYQELYSLAWQEINKQQKEDAYFKLSPVDIYQPKDDLKHKQITFHLDITSYSRTLTTKEVSGLLFKVGKAAGMKFGASVV